MHGMSYLLTSKIDMIHSTLHVTDVLSRLSNAPVPSYRCHAWRTVRVSVYIGLFARYTSPQCFLSQCVENWRQEQDARSQPFLCPLCKEPAVGYYHDCVNGAYQYRALLECGLSNNGVGSVTTTSHPEAVAFGPAHRARRCVAFLPWLCFPN